jgi:hypothetical protein
MPKLATPLLAASSSTSFISDATKSTAAACDDIDDGLLPSNRVPLRSGNADDINAVDDEREALARNLKAQLAKQRCVLRCFLTIFVVYLMVSPACCI